jgi:CHAT domain-containing protein
VFKVRKRAKAILIIIFLLFPLLYGYGSESLYGDTTDQTGQVDYSEKQIREQLDQFLDALIGLDTVTALHKFEFFAGLIKRNSIDSPELLSDAYYYCGFYHLSLSKAYNNAAELLEKSYLIRTEAGLFDRTYRQARLNMGIAYSEAGEHSRAEQVYSDLLKRIKELDGEESQYMVSVYNSFSSAKVSSRDYSGAAELANEGLRVADITGVSDVRMVLNMLITLGISYSRLNDYSRALLYYEQAFQYAEVNSLTGDGIFINLLNSLAVANKTLGNIEAAEYYFEYGAEMPPHLNREAYLLLMNNRALFLAGKGDIESATELSTLNVELAEESYSREHRVYIDNLIRHTRLISEYAGLHSEARSIIEKVLIPWTRKNADDISLVRDIFHSYSQVLSREGRFSQALEALQRSIFPSPGTPILQYDNPRPDQIIPDRIGLQLLVDKADILRSIYRESTDTVALVHGVNTNAFLISLIETMRIDISEEESRMLLGDNYRKVYNSMVSDLALLYDLTGSEKHFNRAFEYAERSKAAGLLVSMRGLRASRFLVPDSLSSVELGIERELGRIREQIAMIHQSGGVGSFQLNRLKEQEFALAVERTELIAMFEREFPDYYNARYNTAVAGVEDVLKITGRRGNYINYLVTDSTLFMFVINRKERALISLPYGSRIVSSLNRFRELLTDPLSHSDMKAVHQEYTVIGYDLYNYLVSPLKEYLISDRIIVSPDNILTYLPFGSLITTDNITDELNYRILPYMVNDFRISYTYSATMFLEKQKRRRSFNNTVLAIAPSYNDSILLDDVLNPRSSRIQPTLADLPFARREAEYVVGRWGGSLYLCDEAIESVYKKNAPRYKVLHLAMHTVINNSEPAYSRLVFSDHPDGEEDGLLNTYEIYTVPLSARMVVIPSCNTGEGLLRTGEGVISLARGFVSAGGESVVMSLWEVDDMHSTEVVLSFYDNLKMGMTKSSALQQAKREFLKEAYQLQGHPYFWATLVLYGDDAPLFHSKAVKLILLFVAALSLFIIIGIIQTGRKRINKER